MDWVFAITALMTQVTPALSDDTDVAFEYRCSAVIPSTYGSIYAQRWLDGRSLAYSMSDQAWLDLKLRGVTTSIRWTGAMGYADPSKLSAQAQITFYTDKPVPRGSTLSFHLGGKSGLDSFDLPIGYGGKQPSVTIPLRVFLAFAEREDVVSWSIRKDGRATPIHYGQGILPVAPFKDVDAITRIITERLDASSADPEHQCERKPAGGDRNI